jgi:hypothetical protein
MLRRFGVICLLCAIGISALARGLQNAPVKPVTASAQVLHKPIDEMSGVVRSRQYSNVYWVHNDSGDSARIFAIREDGSVIIPPWLRNSYYVGEPQPGKKEYPGISVDMATNNDWEDIAIDGDTLYLADTGNNGNARRDLGVYVLPEPNPEGVERARVLKWIPIAYPEQTAYPGSEWHFDCEAIFIRRGKLYFLTKHRVSGQIGTPETGTHLYRLDTQHTDRVNRLKRIDSARDLGGWVTGADLSPDGRTLAVLCHAPVASVWLFEAESGDRFLSGRARRLILRGAGQCEAVCFTDNNTLIVTNEDRDLFRLSVSEFGEVTK